METDFTLKIRATYETKPGSGEQVVTGYSAFTQYGEFRFCGEPDVFAGALRTYALGFADGAQNVVRERTCTLKPGEPVLVRKGETLITATKAETPSTSTEDEAAAAALREIWQAGQNWFKKHEVSE